MGTSTKDLLVIGLSLATIILISILLMGRQDDSSYHEPNYANAQDSGSQIIENEETVEWMAHDGPRKMTIHRTVKVKTAA